MSSKPLIRFFGIDFSIYGLTSSLTWDWLTSAECWVDITTDLTDDGFPSLYSIVIWLF